MLNSFRKFSTGIVTKLLIALLVASFALWGVADMFGGSRQNPTLATVGSEKIHFDQYRRMLSIENDNIRRSLGVNYSPELLKQLKFEQFVLQSMIQKSLLAQEAEAMGLVADDATVAKFIRGNPAFTDENGKFSKERFEALLRTQGYSEKTYTDNIRNEVAASELLNALSIRQPFSANTINMLIAANEENRIITLFKASKETIPAPAAPSDEDLKNHLKEHADEFTTPEFRSASYVTISSKDVAEKGDGANDALTQKTNALEDELAGGSTLKEAAEKMGLKVQSAGNFNRAGLGVDGVASKQIPALDKFIETTFSTDEGSESSLVSSKGTYYIVRVEKITPEALKPFAEIKPALQASWVKTKQQQALSEQMQQLETALAKPDAGLDVVAKFQLKSASNGKINRGSASIGNTPLPPDVITEIYQLSVGKFTRPVRQANGDYVVARLDNIIAGDATNLSKDKVAAFRKSFGNMVENELTAEYLHYLQNKYSVEIDERLFQSILEQKS